MKTIEQLEETIAAFDARIEAALEPFRDAVERLKKVPGLSETSAQILIAENGTDMSQFPRAGHLLSWAGLIPRLDESVGKRRSRRVRKGAPWLKPVLVQCAWAASRKKNSYFAAQFLRLKARRSPKKAVLAMAASILTHRLSHAGQRHLLPGPSAPIISPAVTRPTPSPSSSTRIRNPRRDQAGRMTRRELQGREFLGRRAGCGSSAWSWLGNFSSTHNHHPVRRVHVEPDDIRHFLTSCRRH